MVGVLVVVFVVMVLSEMHYTTFFIQLKWQITAFFIQCVGQTYGFTRNKTILYLLKDIILPFDLFSCLILSDHIFICEYQ